METDNCFERFGRVGVLMGGCSSEKDISLKSGRAVYNSLINQGFNAIALILEDSDTDEIARRIRSVQLDLAFIALHGAQGEDGTIQTLLEDCGVVYTGSGVEASRVALDKVLAYDVFKNSGLRVSPYTVLSRERDGHNALSLAAASHFPVVVKPAREGSSIGISLVDSSEGLESALNEAWQYDDTVLVEEYIRGREMTVGILGESALPVLEIKPEKGFFDFESKYTQGKTQYIVPAQIPETTARNLKEAALKAHMVLGCEDFSRVDFILAEDGSIYCLEINTIPGFTETSLLPKAAAAVGINFDQLILQLMERAYGKKKEAKNAA